MVTVRRLGSCSAVQRQGRERGAEKRKADVALHSTVRIYSIRVCFTCSGQLELRSACLCCSMTSYMATYSHLNDPPKDHGAGALHLHHQLGLCAHVLQQGHEESGGTPHLKKGGEEGRKEEEGGMQREGRRKEAGTLNDTLSRWTKEDMEVTASGM